MISEYPVQRRSVLELLLLAACFFAFLANSLAAEETAQGATKRLCRNGSVGDC
jgi:hypothetical protein